MLLNFLKARFARNNCTLLHMYWAVCGVASLWVGIVCSLWATRGLYREYKSQY